MIQTCYIVTNKDTGIVTNKDIAIISSYSFRTHNERRYWVNEKKWR